MRFTNLEPTIFANVPMRGQFFVAKVPEPSKMADLVPCTKTRLRARRLPEIQADPNSLITVAQHTNGHHIFVAAEDPVWVAKPTGNDDDAPESIDDSTDSPHDEDDAQ